MASTANKSVDVLRRLIPRALVPRVAQLEKDLRTVIAGIRGERAPAYLVRDGARYQARAGLATRELELLALRRETPDAVSLRLADPSGAALPPIRPGQFFTLLLELDGHSSRRAYSVSSDCRQRAFVELAIKRVAGGRVSNWLNDHAAPGMRVRVLGPSGEFGQLEAPPPSRRLQLLMIAGGSGITPMIAMLRSRIDADITLIYANRSLPDVIFADELDALAAELPSCRVLHLLEQPPPDWQQGIRGRADAATLARALEQLALHDTPALQVLLCGPAPMMDGARELLRARGVAEARIHSESFVAPRLHAEAEAQLQAARPMTVVIGAREVGLVVQPGETVLEAGLAAGLALPYSCAMGGCGACKVVLERGEVVMREPNCLSERERAAGRVLACVANPISACRVRVDEPGSTR